jgi:hypothetical protein
MKDASLPPWKLWLSALAGPCYPNRIVNRYRWVWNPAGCHHFLSVLTISGRLPIGSDHSEASSYQF